MNVCQNSQNTPECLEKLKVPQRQPLAAAMDCLVDAPKSLLRTTAMFWKRVEMGTDDECWRWTGAINAQTGYGRIAIHKINYSAHRISYLLHHKMIDRSLNVNHTCDNRWCVNPRHLYQGTQKDNIGDAVKRHRVAVGSRHGCSILSEQDVTRIRNLHAMGVKQRTIAYAFGLGTATVNQIVNRQRWSFIQ